MNTTLLYARAVWNIMKNYQERKGKDVQENISCAYFMF